MIHGYGSWNKLIHLPVKDLRQLQSFYTTERISKKNLKVSKGVEKMFRIHNKWLLFAMYKELVQINDKETAQKKNKDYE